MEILDLECVLCHVIGVQNENKNALINPPSWIFQRRVIYKRSWALTYNRTGLLDRPKKAWSQDGGNMRVFAHEVTC